MTEFICLLISLYDIKHNDINKIAISIKLETISEFYPNVMEKECRALIHSKLPENIQEIGPIVNIEIINNIMVGI